MMSTQREALLVALMIAALTALQLWGIDEVPFHPDETSLLFQSRDLELIVEDPGGMAWRAEAALDRQLQYRLLNPPLPKYILGVGRRLAGYGPDAVSTDWDWGGYWELNVQSGALPTIELLRGARLASTVLLPLTLLAIYLVGRRLQGPTAGIAAVLLLGTSALLMLHGRRAMSEGALVLGVCVAAYGIVTAGRRPWLAGLGAALAFSAKYSAAPLLLAGAVAAFLPERAAETIRGRLRRVLIFGLSAAFVIALLHPVLWAQPIGAGKAMWQERQSLLNGQVETALAFTPEAVMDTAGKRVLVFVVHLFSLPLQYFEVGNYVEAQSAEIQRYDADVLRHLMRGSIGGSIYLALTLAGLLLSLRIPPERPVQRRTGRLLAMAGGLQALALLVVIPLPFQRFYLPMIPFISLWSGYAIGHALDQWKTHRARQTDA